MTHVPAPLPKKGSKSFREERARVLAILDLPRLLVVIEGALDRRSLEDILRKAMKGRALRPGSLPRHKLVAAVAEAFSMNDDVAYLAMRSMDRSCRRERHIVASMPEDQLQVRLESYRAIDFRRERARLIWALIRDGREGHLSAGENVLQEAFKSMADAKREEKALEEGDPASNDETIASVKERLDKYESVFHSQAQELHKERGARENAETERSELLVQLGLKQRALRIEEKRRKDSESEVKAMRDQISELREQVEQLDPERVRSVVEERDRLRDRARSLEREVEHQQQMAELREENDALRGELAQLRREGERNAKEHAVVVDKLASAEASAKARADDLRDALKKARQLAAAPASVEPSLVDGEPIIERVGVFVDVANVSASARRDHGGSFDFLAFLDEAVGDRKRAAAVAFAVDSGDDQSFLGFCRALSAGGYEIRSKKPKVRSDGTRKADWDMGIAMEILDLRNRLDVIVLVSGDGDFVPLLRRLKRWSKRVEVAAFRASTDEALLRVADDYTDLTGRYKI